jgi:phosphopantothenate-cysteine ligase
MKILITSGGTKIPIDTVRSITNMSSGTLGTRMAKEFLEAGHEVIFFKAEGSKSPMSLNADFYQDGNTNAKIEELKRFYLSYRHVYSEYVYKTFEDYKNGLEKCIKWANPDMVILASAVSDYAPKQVMNGKIRTKDNLTIELEPLPKVIASVRDWAGEKAIVVGFKLLVDVDAIELLREALASLSKNSLDFVCANDLKTLQQGNHTLWLCDKEQFEKVSHTKLTARLLGRINELNKA